MGGGGCLCKVLGLSVKFILKKPNAVFTPAWVIKGRACSQLNERLAEEETRKGTFSGLQEINRNVERGGSPCLLLLSTELVAGGDRKPESEKLSNPTGPMD